MKAGLGGAVMLHNLGCVSTVVSPHEDGSLLHTPGHVVRSPLLEGVAGAGPGAGGGAELLAAGIITQAPTGEEAILGVCRSLNH